MGFIYVLLGSSTVQLRDSHDSRRSRACSVVGMATVLEKYATEGQRFVVFYFFGQKDSIQRIFIKKCFLFKVGCVWRRSVQPWWQTFY
jgi:hypothetical protein